VKVSVDLAKLPPFARLAAGVALAAVYAALLLGVRATLWHDAIAFPLAIGIGAALVGNARPRVLWLTLLASTFLSIHLAYLWHVGYGGRNHVFAGVFALSDAGGYYADAERVLHGVPMNGGGVRRPIFSAILAGLLRVIGHDIRLAHVITMLCWASSGAFAASEVWRTHGRRASAIVLVVFVLFARRYVGFVQSEGIGGPLGALAFALAWRASSLDVGWRATYLGALLLLAVAVLGRPGPIFAIVGLVVWAFLREEKRARPRLLLESLGVIAFAFAFQHVIRVTTTVAASYSDLPPILYGHVTGEDSQFVWAKHPELGALAESERGSAIWPLIGRELLARPWLIVVAPLRCLASWLYLPQGFFGFVWLNPDDRVLENGRAVRESINAHGYVGPVLLWVRTLGLYSLVNALLMAGGAIVFVVALVRATWRSWRGRRDAPPVMWPVLVGILVGLPLLPPWITEGAQILASVMLFVVTFAVTSWVPRAPGESPARPAPKLGPVVFAALGLLLLVVKLSPVRPTNPACRDDGSYLADIDRRGAAVYGPGAAHPPLDDARENLRLIEKNNGALARAWMATLDRNSRLLPAYDTCHDQMLYVVDELASPSEALEGTGRWLWLRGEPLAPNLESMNPKNERRLR
jgi:hypothetical protein